MAVQGATLFSDPNGTDWLITVAGGSVFATGPNRTAVELPLNGNTVTGDVSFTQTYDKLLLWRGTSTAPLQLANFADGWVAVTETTSDAGAGTGTEPIPNSDGATFFQNRVFVPFRYLDQGKKDFVAVGDIGNYTRYKFPQNAFRFNDGTDDEIVDLAPFGRTSMIVFKQKSVRYVDNLVPDINGDYSSAVSDEITRNHGLAARSAWTTDGRNLFYVSTRGVTSLQLTEENRVRGMDLPLSAPLEATWARINWNLRDKIRLGYWDNKLYVAVPLDDARVVDTTNLATGTYNPVTGNLSLTVTAGAVYYFEFGLDELTLTNGSETLTRSGFFTAAGSSVVLNGTPSAATTATLNYVPFYNCNNAVAVYDFITQAWAGVDQADYVTHVKEFLTPTIQGRQRLVAVTEDGLLRLWEEGFEDERITTIANPYVDLTVESRPATGKTIQLNTATGDLVTASTAASANSGTTWGTNTVGNARTNVLSGYTASLWTSPGGTVSEQDWGLRFTSSTASLPAFALNGVTIKNSGLFDWCYVDIISGSVITTQAVSLSVTTRGYAMADMDGKRYQRALVRVSTWSPNFTLTAVVDGVNETASITAGQTRSNTSYSTAGTPDWDSSNVNNDHANPYRKDYSLSLGTGVLLGAAGIDPDLHQDALEKIPFPATGTFCQVRITNTDGRCVVKGIALEAIPGDRTAGTKY